LDDQIKEDGIGVACSTQGRNENACSILVKKPERKRPLLRPRPRLEDHIRTNLTEIGCEYVDWIHMAQDRDQW
jgi:hypothetical protein